MPLETDELSPVRATRSSSASEDPQLDESAASLFERLRAWRTETARAREVPPYVVFDDKTLRALALARPADEPGLLAVKGIGPAKAEAYGSDLLDLIATE